MRFCGGSELLPQRRCGGHLPLGRSTAGAGSGTGSSHPNCGQTYRKRKNCAEALFSYFNARGSRAACRPAALPWGWAWHEQQKRPSCPLHGFHSIFSSTLQAETGLTIQGLKSTSSVFTMHKMCLPTTLDHSRRPCGASCLYRPHCTCRARPAPLPSSALLLCRLHLKLVVEVKGLQQTASSGQQRSGSMLPWCRLAPPSWDSPPSSAQPALQQPSRESTQGPRT